MLLLVPAHLLALALVFASTHNLAAQLHLAFVMLLAMDLALAVGFAVVHKHSPSGSAFAFAMPFAMGRALTLVFAFVFTNEVGRRMRAQTLFLQVRNTYGIKENYVRFCRFS